jgi:hypothetical protein
VSLSSFLAASFGSLPSEYIAKGSSLGEQSISSIDPRVAYATNQLAESMRLSTIRVTDLIDKVSDTAGRQFKDAMPADQQPAERLSDALKLTLVESISNTLREQVGSN